MRLIKLKSLLAILLAFHLSICTAFADSRSTQAAKFASEEGNLLFLTLGIGINVLEDDNGLQRTLRAGDSVLTSSAISEILKITTREERPDGAGHRSFPSGHATAAFAAATVQSEYHPWQLPLWMSGAGLIAASRVKLHRHYIHDVVAGGILGMTTAEVELASQRGLLLFPVIDPAEHRVAVQAIFNW